MNGSKYFCLSFCIIFLLSLAGLMPQSVSDDKEKNEVKHLIIRADDFGMTNGVNMALKELINTGYPLSVSVMPPTPWFLQAVEILKKHPEISVGIHLTLNSEWKNYRWGPVLGASTVPTLVGDNGYFFPSAADLYNNNPDLGEVDRELRAQIDMVLKNGLKVDYLDFHMGTAIRNPEFRKVTEKIAEDYELGLSGYFGETVGSPHYWAPADNKIDSLLTYFENIEETYNTVVFHVAKKTPEMEALVDMNEDNPLPNMYLHRHGELVAITSDEFRRAIEQKEVQLINYRELIEMKGLDKMKRLD